MNGTLSAGLERLLFHPEEASPGTRSGQEGTTSGPTPPEEDTAGERKKKGRWIEELPKVLWSIRTTTSRTTGFTPFKLVYGEEAVTPAEVLARSPRVILGRGAPEEQTRPVNLDLLDANRTEAVLALERYHAETASWYNKKVKLREGLVPGDMVLKKRHHSDTVGKLEPKWEGPYLVTRVRRADTYELSTPEGARLGHTWNGRTLKKYYV